MTRALICLSLVVVVATAHADAVADHLERARQLHDSGDYTRARDELLAAFELDPRPELLFALGQIEFNLGHYQAAIDYYQRFNASSPNADQAALAEQAIGAARIKLAQPPPAREVAYRHWDRYDTAISVGGGVAVVVGGGLLVDAALLANDHSGTLAAYNARLSHVRTMRIAGPICAGAGVVAIAAAVLRWRLHFEHTTIAVGVSATGASVIVGGTL